MSREERYAYLTKEQFDFMSAVSGLDYKTVESMLQSGLLNPSFQHTESGKYTPLHCAIDSEIDWSQDNPNPDGRMVQILLQNGADPNIVDRQGRSPLDWARGDSEVGPIHPKAYELLIQYGAKTGEELTGIPARKVVHGKTLFRSMVEGLSSLWNRLNKEKDP
jgi:ankyrin repeat protein